MSQVKLLSQECARLAQENKRLRSLVTKLAPAVFVDSEGGGHDLGLWLDCGEITEWDYTFIKEALL